MYRNAPFKPPRPSSGSQSTSSELSTLKRPASQNTRPVKRLHAPKLASSPVPTTQRDQETSLFVSDLESPERTSSRSSQNNDVSVVVDHSQSTKYVVQWRKKSNKKNKTWEGDGTAVVNASTIVLRDEDGNLLSKKLLNSPTKLDLTSVIPLGIYEIEINEPITAEQQIPAKLFKSQLNTVTNTKPSRLFSKINPESTTLPPQTKLLSSKYSVQWRKRSTKKNKTWEGDGVLVVHDNGISLKNDDGTTLSKKSQTIDNLELNSILSIGIYEVEVNDPIDAKTNPHEPQPTLPRPKPLSRTPLTTGTEPARLNLSGQRLSPQPTGLNEVVVSKYLIQWRKKSNKKNKTWDGDGTIVSTKGDRSIDLVLKDSDAKILSKKSFSLSAPPNFVNSVFSIGGFEFEVEEEIETTNLDNQQIGKLPFKPVCINREQNKKPKAVELNSGTDPTVLDTNSKSILLPRNEAAKFDVAIDPHLAVHLRPHQVEGVKFLYECVMGYRDFEGMGCLLADEMGLGKTLMTISLIWTLIKQNPVKRGPTITNVLIVCPVTLINNWVNEFKKWLGPNKVGILTLNGNNASDRSNIINFGKLNVYQVLIMNYEKIGTYFEELSGVSFDLMICDEGHRLKSSTNKVLNYLTNLRIPKKVLLTGTPIQNDLVEFYTIINFVNPGLLGEFKLFQKEFINPIVKSRDVNCYDLSLKKKGEELSKELIRMTQKFILRRTQSILTKYLTKKTDLIIFVPPTQLQIRLFKFILNLPNFLEQIDSSNQALTLINVFKKICNSPSLLANDACFKSIEQNGSFQLTTSSGKINILIPLLLEITSLKEKVVLISNYTKTLNLLELILKKLNLSFIRLDGSTPNNMRSKLVNSFNKNDSINVFLLSSKAGGMGINLVGASRLILFDNDWNPAIDLQSMSRIHRDGQQKHCFIYRLMTTGCIDEKIFQRQLMKNNLSSTFLDNETKKNDNVFDDYEMKKLFEIDYATNCNTHDLLECTCKGEGTEVVEDMDNTLNDEQEAKDSDDEEEPATQSWISARKLMDSINENEDALKTNSKVQIKKALSDYVHFDPNVAEANVLEDKAVVNILSNKQFKANKSYPMSFILCKTIDNIVPETESVEIA